MKHQRTSTRETNTEPPVAHLSRNGPIDTATLELLAAWRIEDATEDPEKIRAAEQELAEFKKAMNENRIRAQEPLLYP
jgi:hypothetical protein